VTGRLETHLRICTGTEGGPMRVAAKRRQAGWVIAAQLLDGTERPVRLADGAWVDVVLMEKILR